MRPDLQPGSRASTSGSAPGTRRRGRTLSFKLPVLALTLLSILNHYPTPASAQTALSIYPPNAAASADVPQWTAGAEYDPLVVPPPAASGAGPTVQLNLPQGGLPGMSIPLGGDYLGFSIELSVIHQILGPTGKILLVPFLNLMGSLQHRGGSVAIRVGGNTQDLAVLVDQTPNNKTVQKLDLPIDTSKTETPTLIFTPEVTYAMGNISTLLNVNWFIGVPFNDTAHPRLEIVELSQQVLGDRLLGMQLGNEPDLYSANGRRAPTYQIPDYINDIGTFVGYIDQDSQIPRKDILIVPSTCCFWNLDQLFGANLLSDYASSLNMLAVQYYPLNNCPYTPPHAPPPTPEEAFPDYMSHTRIQRYASQYTGAIQTALAAGKPTIMMETNTAACGGFPGLSDAFVSALWGVDYTLQLAAVNFSRTMIHVGGQNDYYNPFTPPPTNMSLTHGWTIGPMYYVALFVAETLGKSGAAQVVDLQANGNSPLTPGYAIYENGKPTRAVLVNYDTDPSGRSDWTAALNVGPGVTSATVKYLEAPSTSSHVNITWAGQTLGGPFESDGRLMGNETSTPITCTGGVCNVRVKAPSAALVFFSEQALDESDDLDHGAETLTFATSVYTGYLITATVPQAVLETSNGFGPGFLVNNKVPIGSTSRQSSNKNRATSLLMSGAGFVLATLCTLGAAFVLRL